MGWSGKVACKCDMLRLPDVGAGLLLVDKGLRKFLVLLKFLM